MFQGFNLHGGSNDATRRQANRARLLHRHSSPVSLAAPARRIDALDLGGSCQGCGTCCEAPAIRVGRATWYLPTLRAFLLWWHEAVHRFHLQSVDKLERRFVFTCDHFDWVARRCDSYKSRPGMCRDYPRALPDQPAPVLFPRCRYRALAANRLERVQILEMESLGLPPERLGRLKTGLYLEDD